MSSQHINHLTQHFKEFHSGVNWTWANLKETLSDITYLEAIHQFSTLNTIVGLTYHIHYYYITAIKVLQGGPVEGSDKYSFDHPEIKSEADWEDLQKMIFAQADLFITLLSQLEENKLWETFGEEKYGDYYRNIVGTLEHSHYHLGQIVVLKKLIRSQ